MTPLHYELITRNSDETRAIAQQIAQMLQRGDVLLLHGDLGAGKTTFTQGIARGLGVVGYVQSPTFTLATEHHGYDGHGQPIQLYHIDLYRLNGRDDVDSFGFEQYLDAIDGITVVEWPERAETVLPDRYLLVTFDYAGPNERHLSFRPSVSDQLFANMLEKLAQATSGVSLSISGE